MKKFLIVALAIMLMAAPAFALNVKSVVNNFVAGSSSTDKEEVTCMVYNATESAISNGEVLVYYVGGTDEGRSVTRCNGLGQVVAGVANEDIASASWGQMLVYGYHSAVYFKGAAGNGITAGYGLYAYGTGVGSNEAASTYDGYAGSGYLVGTAKNAKSFATALDAATTGTTVEAFVNAL
jgi:hypothetical protein